MILKEDAVVGIPLPFFLLNSNDEIAIRTLSIPKTEKSPALHFHILDKKLPFVHLLHISFTKPLTCRWSFSQTEMLDIPKLCVSMLK